MELINAARHTLADTFTALDKSGHEHLVIVAKAHYSLPTQNHRLPRPLPPPQSLADTDVWAGAPGLSAPLYESDYVLRKPMCDVLFNAQAHLMPDERLQRLSAGFELGSLQKMLVVHGRRQWKIGLSTSASDPEFIKNSIPLHMGNAYGGTVRISAPHAEPIETALHPENPMGTGYCPNSGLLLRPENAPPSVELLNMRATGAKQRDLRPGALSVLPRTSATRGAWAGTYDEAWRRDVFPFLPQDFDERYFQSAPADQQIPYPEGGEIVRLHRLVPGHKMLEFQLPRLGKLKVRLLTQKQEIHELKAVVDTLYFETESGRMSVVWRAQHPMKNIHDIKTVALGAICQNWWAAKLMGVSHCGGCSRARSTENPANETDCAAEAAQNTLPGRPENA